MKESNTNTIEEGIVQALSMYKETVSPSRNTLINLLNQIPEKENVKVVNDGRAIRSPYIWLAFTRATALFMILFAVFPTVNEAFANRDNPFYYADKQVENFEAGINEEDYANLLVNYNNM